MGRKTRSISTYMFSSKLLYCTVLVTCQRSQIDGSVIGE